MVTTTTGKCWQEGWNLKSGNANVYKTYGKVDSPTFAVAGDFYHNTDLATTVMGYGADVIFRASGIAFLANTEFKTSNQPMMMLPFYGILIDE